MPRPAVLPTIDWANLIEQSADYQSWLNSAESQQNATAIEQARKSLLIDSAINQFLTTLPRPVYVIAIAEDWCGDVVRHVPVLQKMADHSDKLVVKYLSRMDRPDIFARYLTNGGEAIPKFVFLSADFVECGNWGPMPAAEKLLISRGKASNNVSQARKQVADCYAKDPNKDNVVKELKELIETAAAEHP